MRLALKIIFSIILVAMLGVTSWAGYRCPLFGVPHDVATHPWFIATLFDAYAGFVTFAVWVCYQQLSWAARLAWVIAILLLGNIAMAAYCLNELRQAPAGESLTQVLIARHSGTSALGVALAFLGAAVTIFAALAKSPT
jgi:hypothetical protein